MCGIVGYIGTREAYDILIQGLHRLEYRGYDSAGVALINRKDELHVYKAKGKVSDLETAAADKDCSGVVGIAHTRWATHGEPSVRNAHPHVSESGNLAMVHNGIIENFALLRDQLQARGFHFQSDTDTEVLVQLVEYAQKRHRCPLAEAVRHALRKCIGAYAIVVIDRRDPSTVVAARKGSPMVIGIGKDSSEFFIASDVTPIAGYTQDVVYVDDEQIAVCQPGKPLEIIDLKNKPVDVNVKQIDVDLDMLDKGGFPHYMLKEIFDQPRCLHDCMSGRLLGEDVILSAVRNNRARLLSATRLVIVACGTSWHAGLIAKQLIEHFCKIPVEIDYASEFRYRDPVIYSSDVVIAISQSGETADTLAAIKLAKERGAFIFGIVNAVGSSIARETETGVYIHVGPEIGVASTKAFTGQLTCLTLLTLALAHAKGTIAHDELAELTQELARIPEKIELTLTRNDQIQQLARTYTYATNFLYLGRGWNYPVALEGALKLKEISYIHAEGYPAAEMKHGPIALVDNMMPVLFIATHHEGYEKIISNMQEVKARGGRIIAVVTEGDTEVSKIADQCISVPQTLAPLAPLLSVIPLQLLAYHIAVEKGLNVDMPRNLAKSVTVE
ncbi:MULTISPECIES: glutamine--fructose-6-phosphate transaminase (isomerizing) [Prevotellaceae]|uniref:Glutamine--fructose-6-phosphate aminotransferase [isomerizing] n=2 Tax=Prevotellaceae TaxID=171552 RepID=F9D507_PREDD|nr:MULTISPECIES: glutamine--fructose-6-phosphate transaminase (isomerizing) [Prevotellaceae]AGB29050.1 glucosamine--fructose-6-phosphate aminotransferase, isomerizing [Prevotella dentalis DSM 3688]EGQ13428.1 glutamine-fructose-6-phosphate transaminase [Prevotella dentalis DSM 3688]